MGFDEESVLIEETGAGLFQVRLTTGEASFLSDEPVAVGGLSSGPDPFDLACAALGACTVMTMRLYARRKGWDLPPIRASIRHSKASASARDRFERSLCVSSALDPDQRQQLLAIADRCPVHRLLEPGADIVTELVEAANAQPRSEALHGRIISEICGEDCA